MFLLRLFYYGGGIQGDCDLMSYCGTSSRTGVHALCRVLQPRTRGRMSADRGEGRAPGSPRPQSFCGHPASLWLLGCSCSFPAFIRGVPVRCLVGGGVSPAVVMTWCQNPKGTPCHEEEGNQRQRVGSALRSGILCGNHGWDLLRTVSLASHEMARTLSP